MATYDKMTSLKNPGRPVQVESAVRDGSGKNIENNYAKQDGYYATLGAGQADSIASNREIDNPDVACPPITFGITGGEAEIQTGINKLEYLEGKSIVFNQNLKYRSDVYVRNGCEVTYDENHNKCKFTLTATSTASSSFAFQFVEANIGKQFIDHTVLMRLHLNASSNHFKAMRFQISCGLDNNGSRLDVPQGKSVYCQIKKNATGSYGYLSLSNGSYSPSEIVEGDTLEMAFELFDLTLMGLDDITVEEFNKMFPLDYYEYNAGSILSSKSASLISRGKNQFSGLNTFIRVVPGQEYELSGISAGSLVEYDANQNEIETHSITGRTVLTMSDNTHYVKITATSYEEIMFYLTFSEDGGVYNEPYEEYREQVVTLPNIELRSVPDYANGGEIRDIAYAIGGGKRRVGIVDLGSLDWHYETNRDTFVTYNYQSQWPSQKSNTTSQVANALCSKLIVVSRDDMVSNNINNSLSMHHSDTDYITVKATQYGTDAATFKAAMSGVYLIYELATETDIPLSENPGWAELVYTDNFGTIEFTTSPVQIPQVEQPYFIRYTISLTEFLDTAYVHCEGDGNNIATEEEAEAFRKGTDAVGLARASESLTPYSEESGSTGTTPFVMQTAGGSSDIGSQAQLKALRGNSVAFNQLVENGNFESTSGWYTIGTSGSLSVANNIAKVTKTSNATLYLYRANASYPTLTNHKYLHTALVRTSHNATLRFSCGNSYMTHQSIVANTWTRISFIASPTSYGGFFSDIEDNNTLPVDGYFETKEYNVIDLTIMFGAGNEPTSVEEFNRLFPKPYYEYNTGELLSSKVNGIKNVGCNAFDGELELGSHNNTTGEKINDNTYFRGVSPIKVIAGQTYTVSTHNYSTGTVSIVRLFEYDENHNYIKRQYYNGTEHSFTLGDTTCYVELDFANNNVSLSNIPNIDIAFHLTWDGSRTGYEPYHSETYPLPNVELRSAGSVYDELRPDGTLIRRVGVYTFSGEESWTEYGAVGSGNFYAFIDNLQYQADTSILPNLVCSKYSTDTFNNIVGGQVSNIITTASNNNRIIVRISGATTSSAVATAMNGVTIYYELAEPTEEQTENTFQEIQDIDDFGTQEFLYDEDIDIPVPQGAEFFYPVDYKAFIDSLGGREDINYDAGEIVSHEELDVVDDKHDSLYAIMQENIGGLLKHQLVARVISEGSTLDFHNIGVLDLGEQAWMKETYTYDGKACFRFKFRNIDIESGTSSSVIGKIICPIYPSDIAANSYKNNVDKIISLDTDHYIDIYDSDFENKTANELKESLKGILLAYEKASS